MEYAEARPRRLAASRGIVSVLGKVLRQPLGALGLVIVVGLLAVAILAPAIAPYSEAQQDIARLLEPPSRDHLLGTDHIGRDLLSRLVFGSRIALVAAIPSVSIALLGGLVLGMLAGYSGGWVDNVVVIVLDTIQAFPAVILALAMLATLGPSLRNVILVIGFAWIPSYARVTRSQVLSVKEQDYILAERALGAGRLKIVVSHILPNILAPLMVLVAMDLPVVITFEAGLSFLGLGVRPPTPSWGVILSDGFKFIRNSPWPILWSALTLMVTTLGFSLFGEALRDVLDPRLSGTRGL